MTPKEELLLYSKKYPWAFDELVVDQKMQEANRLVSQGVKANFSYLKEVFGSGNAALGAIKQLVKDQPRPLKSLHLPGKLEAHIAALPSKKKRKK